MANYRAFEQKYPTFSKFVGAAREAASVMPGASYLTPAGPMGSPQQHQSYADAQSRFQKDSPYAAAAGKGLGYGIDTVAAGGALGALGKMAGAGTSAFVTPTVGALAGGVGNAASLIPSAAGLAAKAINYAPLAAPALLPTFATYANGGKAPQPAVDASFNNVASMGKATAEDIKSAYDRLNANKNTFNEDVYAPKPPAAKAAQPAMSYDEWVMKQPVSKLDADGYARRAQLEIEKRRPETTRQNAMMAANYAFSHPEMMTGETIHRDGSVSRTYGDRAANAMQGYGTFADHLDNIDYKNRMADAAMVKAKNGEKFGADDKSAALTGMFGGVFDGVPQGTPLSSMNDLPARKAKFNQALIAASAMGAKLPWDDFEQYAAAQGYPLEAQKQGWFW